MSDRDDKLKKLRVGDAAKNTVIITSAEPFTEALDEKIEKLKDTLGLGVEITNIDELIDELGNIKSLENEVSDLKKSISQLVIPEMPKNVEIKGLEDLIKATQVLSKKKDIQKIDISTLTPITDQVGNLINAIEEIVIPKQGQEPGDYLPMRRVIKVGNKLLYDDSFYTGGGGGSSVPEKNGAVPVVNPDGSLVGSGGGGGGGAATIADGADVAEGATADATVAAGATGTVSAKLRRLTTDLDANKTSVASIDTKLSSQATAAKQDTGNTSLASIDGKITAVNTGAVTISAALPAGNNNIGDVDVVSVPTDPFGANADAASATGSISAKLRFIASTGIPVTGTVTVGSHAVTNAGTFAVQATEADGANTTLGSKADAKSTATDTTAITIMQVLKQISASVQAPPSQAVTNAGTFAVQAASAGDVANDGVDSGNPVKVGGVAKTSLPTAVADADRVNALYSKNGAAIVHSQLREQLGNQQTTITSSTAETTIVTADGTYLLDLYGLIITNTSSTFTKVTIKDDTAGTTRMVISVPAQDTRGFMLPADSGHKQAVVNKPWTATCGTSVSAIEITALVNKRL